MNDRSVTADSTHSRPSVAAWTVVGICFAVLSVIAVILGRETRDEDLPR